MLKRNLQKLKTQIHQRPCDLLACSQWLHGVLMIFHHISCQMQIFLIWRWLNICDRIGSNWIHLNSVSVKWCFSVIFYSPSAWPSPKNSKRKTSVVIKMIKMTGCLQTVLQGGCPVTLRRSCQSDRTTSCFPIQFYSYNSDITAGDEVTHCWHYPKVLKPEFFLASKLSLSNSFLEFKIFLFFKLLFFFLH